MAQPAAKDLFGKKLPRVPDFTPDTYLARQLVKKEIGVWRHHPKFLSAKQKQQWLEIERLYSPVTIQRKIDYFISRSVPSRQIVAWIIKALQDNVIPDKPLPEDTWEGAKVLEE